MDPMGYGIIACSGNSHCSYMAFSGINIINMLLLYDGKWTYIIVTIYYIVQHILPNKYLECRWMMANGWRFVPFLWW
jgi:hypothetical protein